MKLLDRLTGRQVEAKLVARERLHLGRWTRVDAPNAWILTEADGAWTLAGASEGEVIAGEGFPGSWPDEGPLENALRALGDQLDELRELDGCWDDWAEECPIPKNLAQALEPEPLEAILTKELRHLEAVCRAPHTHIELHTEHVALGRARKLDRRAPQRLATHSEDWAARRISGVVPRRILALVREPRWDLYENRVAARLVDHLVTWLRRRVMTLRQIQAEIFAELDTETAAQGSHQRRTRLCAVWGDSWDNDRLGATLRAALIHAERCLYRALGLMSSPLYQKVPRGAQVELRLRTTNLLRHDDDYRGVARLWRAWARATRPQATTPRERQLRARTLALAFESWCALLVIRACVQLHLRPCEAQRGLRIERGCRIELGSGIELHWTPHGTIRICEGDALRVEFVPLIQALERADGRPSPARVRPLIAAVEESALPGWRVILHPGAASESHIARVQAPPSPSCAAGALDFVRVSPLALDGVERVARALRWATLVPKMLAYPPRVDIPPELAQNWPLERVEGELVLRTPVAAERLDALEEELGEANTLVTQLEKEHSRVAGDARAAHGKPRKRARLNLEKKRLNIELDRQRTRAKQLEVLKGRLAAASAQLEELRRCPVCAEPCEFRARSQASFIGRCVNDDCRALFELRPCHGTGERVPVLLLESAMELPWDQEPSVTKTGRLVGADVLALPHAEPDGSVGFGRPLPGARPGASRL